MLINFTKMHGLGNDFVVIDAISQDIDLTPEQVRFIADRRFGIGCDQVLLVESPEHSKSPRPINLPAVVLQTSSPANKTVGTFMFDESRTVDFKYRIFNADGGEVEQCGNGARCFARFVREKKLTTKSSIVVETYSGIIHLQVDEQEMVTIDMGKPVFEAQQLPFLPSVGDSQQDNRYTLTIDRTTGQETVEFSAVSMGNPHITLKVDDLDSYPVQEVGQILESHPSFPNRINVGFMQIINKQQIRLRVYERGSGETLACGTGACAAVANAITHNWLAAEVEVKLPAGSLHIQWQQGGTLIMTGPASFVYEGQIIL